MGTVLHIHVVVPFNIDKSVGSIYFMPELNYISKQLLHYEPLTHKIR